MCILFLNQLKSVIYNLFFNRILIWTDSLFRKFVKWLQIHFSNKISINKKLLNFLIVYDSFLNL